MHLLLVIRAMATYSIIREIEYFSKSSEPELFQISQARDKNDGINLTKYSI